MKYNILIFAFVMIFTSAFSQNGKIEGKIYDKLNNEPLHLQPS